MFNEWDFFELLLYVTRPVSPCAFAHAISLCHGPPNSVARSPKGGSPKIADHYCTVWTQPLALQWRSAIHLCQWKIFPGLHCSIPMGGKKKLTQNYLSIFKQKNYCQFFAITSKKACKLEGELEVHFGVWTSWNNYLLKTSVGGISSYCWSAQQWWQKWLEAVRHHPKLVEISENIPNVFNRLWLSPGEWAEKRELFPNGVRKRDCSWSEHICS